MKPEAIEKLFSGSKITCFLGKMFLSVGRSLRFKDLKYLLQKSHWCSKALATLLFPFLLIKMKVDHIRGTSY